MDKQNVTWSEFGELVEKLSDQISKSSHKYEGIIGISRGGLPIAVALSHSLDLDISHIIRAASYDKDNQQSKLQIFTQPNEDLDTEACYLIIDDICDTGQTLDEISKMFPASDTVSLFLKPGASHVPTFWQQEGDKWIVFPWE